MAKRNFQYWFGYYNYHGVMQAIAGTTEDGVQVGTQINWVQKHEITEREWDTLTLADLEKCYPFKEVDNPTA